MSLTDWLIIVAILLGPGIALALNRHLDRQRDRRRRQSDIFRTLMATRAQTTSWRHLEALNAIDSDFDGADEKERAVMDAWKTHAKISGDPDLSAGDWAEKHTTSLVTLLEKMAQVLGKRFDREHVARSAALRMPMTPGGHDL